MGGSERDLGQVLDAVLDGVVVVDAQGRVERLNAEACRLLGISSEAAAGCAAEALPAGEVLAGRIRECLRGGLAQLENEVPLGRGGGTAGVGTTAGVLLVDVATAPLVDSGGAVDGAVLLLRDRSVGATLREAHEARTRDELFGCFATGIAHEVRNPLGGIRGAAELLVRRAGDGRSRRTAELILGEVDRIAGLVEELLVFAPGKGLALAPVNLHRVLDDVLGILAHDPLAATARIERAFDPSLPELLADGDRLRQVFLNLGRNALEAMGKAEGARLGVSTRLALDHRIDLGGEEGGPGGARGGTPCVWVEVSDTGCGIPEALRRYVATPLFSTKSRGMGLGLSLSRHFVSQHGGTLQLLSPPEGGTTVRVALPLRRVS